MKKIRKIRILDLCRQFFASITLPECRY